MGILSDVEIREFHEKGFLLASGLIPDDVSRAAESRLRELVQAGQSGSEHGRFDEPALIACYTESMLQAAAELAGEDRSDFPPPDGAYVINSLPAEGPWEWPHPHIDHAIRKDGHKTFPRAFRIAAMTYLSDVGPHGGGTVVWPGSHRKLRVLAESDPARYEYMWVLNDALGSIDLGTPLEVTAKRGDALFYDTLCAHAGSSNVTDRPRLAMNCKW